MEMWGSFELKLPFKVEQGMSFEFTFIDPLEPPDPNVGINNCVPSNIANTVDPNILQISCADTFHGPPEEGAVLTIIVSK
jgi:hypothetical protein